MNEESEKAGLKLNIKETKIMASGPITSWQIEGEKVEAVTDFLFLGSKITVDGDYSHEIKRCLLLGRASLAAQSIKNLSAMQETCVRSLDWEDPLEEDIATHSSILAWRICMDGGAWRATVHRIAKSQTRLSD